MQQAPGFLGPLLLGHLLRAASRTDPHQPALPPAGFLSSSPWSACTGRPPAPRPPEPPGREALGRGPAQGEGTPQIHTESTKCPLASPASPPAPLASLCLPLCPGWGGAQVHRQTDGRRLMSVQCAWGPGTAGPLRQPGSGPWGQDTGSKAPGLWAGAAPRSASAAACPPERPPGLVREAKGGRESDRTQDPRLWARRPASPPPLPARGPAGRGRCVQDTCTAAAQPPHRGTSQPAGRCWKVCGTRG